MSNWLERGPWVHDAAAPEGAARRHEVVKDTHKERDKDRDEDAAARGREEERPRDARQEDLVGGLDRVPYLAMAAVPAAPLPASPALGAAAGTSAGAAVVPVGPVPTLARVRARRLRCPAGCRCPACAGEAAAS